MKTKGRANWYIDLGSYVQIGITLEGFGFACFLAVKPKVSFMLALGIFFLIIE